MISSLATMSRDGLSPSKNSSGSSKSSTSLAKSFFRASSERNLPGSKIVTSTPLGEISSKCFRSQDSHETYEQHRRHLPPAVVFEGTRLLLPSNHARKAKYVNGEELPQPTPTERKHGKSTPRYTQQNRSTSLNLPPSPPLSTKPLIVSSPSMSAVSDKRASSMGNSFEGGVTSSVSVDFDGNHLRLPGVSTDYCLRMSSTLEVGDETEPEVLPFAAASEQMGSRPSSNSEMTLTSIIIRPNVMTRDLTIPLIGSPIICQNWMTTAAETGSQKSTKKPAAGGATLPCDSAFWSSFDFGDLANGRQQPQASVPLLSMSIDSDSHLTAGNATMSSVGSARRKILKKNFTKKSATTCNFLNSTGQAKRSPVLEVGPGRRKFSTPTSKIHPLLRVPALRLPSSKSSGEILPMKMFGSANRSKFQSVGNIAWNRKRRTTAPPTSLQLLPTAAVSNASKKSFRPEEAEVTEATRIRRMSSSRAPFKGRTFSTTAIFGDETCSDNVTSPALSGISQSTGSTPTSVSAQLDEVTQSRLAASMTNSSFGGGNGFGWKRMDHYSLAHAALIGADTGNGRSRVRINVSGQRFETRLFMLDRHPTTLLGDSVRRRRFYDVSRRELFFDRHRPSFEAIFIYLQTGGRLRRPYHVPDDVFLAELEFYELEADAVDEYKRSEGYTFEESPMPTNPVFRRIWELFECPETSRAAFIVALLSVSMTLISIVLFCVETLPQFNKSHCEEHEAPNFADPFFILESICTFWFTIEAIMRFIACPDKIDFWKDFKNVVDVTAVIPYYVTLFNVLSTMSCQSAKASASLSFLRVIRLVRVFKLTKHSVGLQVLVLTFKASLEGLGLFLVALIVSLLVFSSAIYYAELGHGGENSQMSSIPDAFWWAIITMTTVGYGDKVPVGIVGKLVGAACAITGVLTLAIPVPIITGHFNRFYAHKTGRGRHV